MARDFYEFGPFRLDPAGRRLLRDGAPVILTPKVFDTLLVLVEHHGQSLSRSELVARIWPETSVGEHNLNQSIAVLRKVLEDNPRQPDYIATLPDAVFVHCRVRRAEVQQASNGSQPVQVPANGNAIPGRWRYAAAGLTAVAMVAALTLVSPLGSRVRSNTRSMIEAMRPALYAAPPPSVSVLPFEDLGYRRPSRKNNTSPAASHRS